MVGKRDVFFEKVGRESGDIARNALCRFFAGKGIVKKTSDKGKQGDKLGGECRRGDARPIPKVQRLQEETQG